MKQLLCLIMIFALCVGLCACQLDTPGNTTGSESPSTSDTITSTTPTQAAPDSTTPTAIQTEPDSTTPTSTEPPTTQPESEPTTPEEYYTPELVFKISEDQTAYRVTGMRNNSKDTDLVIPSVYRGLPVTEIGTLACAGQKFTSVTIPDSIMYIGGAAFYNCKNLTTIILGNGLISVESNAFADCGKLNYNSDSIGKYLGTQSNPYYLLVSLNDPTVSEVHVPFGVAVIGGRVFSDCSNLTRCVLPDSLISIGEYAFYNCLNLSEINIPETVTSIGKSVFSNCSNLTEISIPAGVQAIQEYTFVNCYSLTKISIPDSVHSIGISAFKKCSSLTEVDLPDHITCIERGTFAGCKKLTSITIPDSVTSIGDNAFLGCNELASITLPKGLTSIGDTVFRSCSNLKEILLPTSIVYIGKYPFPPKVDINYAGTKEQWNSVEKAESWNSDKSTYTIHCTDGDIEN